MKAIGRMMAMCLLVASMTAFAQSSGGEMKQDDTMKHDDMKNDNMKKN